jgi:hypothetical protein
MKLNKQGVFRVLAFWVIFIFCVSFMPVSTAQPTLISSDKAVNAAVQLEGWNATELASYRVFTELRYLKEENGWLYIYTTNAKTGNLTFEQILSLQIPDPVAKLRGYYWYVSVNTNPNADIKEAGTYSYDFWVDAVNATVAHSNSPVGGDWQLGWKTYNSNGSKGINANIYSDQTFLTGWVSILEGFTDDKGYWMNIGVGNDTGGSGYSNPPVVWMEVCNPSGTQVAHYALANPSYNTSNQCSIVYSYLPYVNLWVWGWFYQGKFVEGYSDGGTVINSGGSINMIENIAPTQPRNSPYTHNLFTNGLQYTNYSYYDQPPYSLPGFYNPSSFVNYNNSAPGYMSTTINTSTPYTISFTWTHS